MKKISIAIIVITIMCMLSTGCSNNNPNTITPSEQPKPTASEFVQPASSKETPAPSESITTPAVDPDFSNVYAAYLNVLRSNEANIKAHTWHRGIGVVYVRDLFGDATPEMFLLRATVGGFVTYLDVYTYDGQAKLIASIQVDEVAGAGMRYAMFTTPDGVYLYSSGGGEPWMYTFSKYELKDGALVVVDDYMHKKIPSADYKITTHSYAHNGVVIEEKEYLAATSALIDAMDSHILYGSSEEEPIWMKIAKIRNSGTMDYADAVVFLTTNAGDAVVDPTPSEPTLKPSSGPFTEDMAIAYMTPLILQEWPDLIEEDLTPDRIVYEVYVSDRLYDSESIYLVSYTLVRLGGGTGLVFADGTVISKTSPEYANYNGYFGDIDITNLNQS